MGQDVTLCMDMQARFAAFSREIIPPYLPVISG